MYTVPSVLILHATGFAPPSVPSITSYPLHQTSKEGLNPAGMTKKLPSAVFDIPYSRADTVMIFPILLQTFISSVPPVTPDALAIVPVVVFATQSDSYHALVLLFHERR